MSRRAIVVLGAVAALGLAGGVAWTLLASGTRSEDGSSYSLDSLLANTDAIAYVDGVRSAGSSFTDPTGAAYYALSLDSTMGSPASYPTGSGRSAQVLPSDVVATSAQRTDGTSLLASLAPSHVYLVGFTYVDPAVFLDRASPWSAKWAFDVTSGEFMETASAKATLGQQLRLVDPHHRAATLGAWRAELQANKTTHAMGPIMSAWAKANHGPGAADEWYAADPSVRGLDAELTPPKVLATLTQRSVYYEIPAANADWGAAAPLTISVRCKDGVSDSFVIDIGPHSATMLVSPHSQVEVYLTRMGSPGGVLLGRFPDSQWAAGDAGLLTMTSAQLDAAIAALAHASGNSDASHSPLDLITLRAISSADRVTLESPSAN